MSFKSNIRECDSAEKGGLSALRKMAIFALVAVGVFFSLRAATQPVPVSAAVSHSPVTVTKKIEDIQLGMRVVGRNPLRHETSAPSQISPESWRAIHLSMNYQGTEYKLAFLRSTDWLESVSATPGASIHLALAEMGLDGPASVDSIEPCPVIEPDDDTGRMVVTGTMRHLAANIIDLHVSGLEQPIGVTFTHPIWSETRQEFVQAGKLQAGEELRTLTASIAVVQSVSPRIEEPETVLNLEVDGEHVYLVTEAAVLAHNACGLGNIGSHAPMDAGIALEHGMNWIGAGYIEIAPGVFRSSDGLRQFRMTTADILGLHGQDGPHVHIEALNQFGTVTENLHLSINP